ncbi:hypothetical protein C8R47DRAFT_1313813 [Mycena vitilis]|nr:hypothetical protein C8R47DRAFT_1313813 [Mycena vitilis]
MSSSQPVQAQSVTIPDVGVIASPLLIGSIVYFFLYGTILVQTYIYRICFPKDSWGVKLLVYSIVLALTVCTCLDGADVQSWYGKSFGQPQAFDNRHSAPIYSGLMSSVIAAAVQVFFCYRIIVIKRAAWPICVLIALLTIVELVGGMAMGIVPHRPQSHSSREETLMRMWLIPGAITDVLIAVTMTYLLLSVEVDPSTRDIVKDIVHLVLETNTLSAVVALIALGLYIGFDNLYFTTPLLMLPGIYANTLLATLNHRAVIKRLKGRRNYDVAL